MLKTDEIRYSVLIAGDEEIDLPKILENGIKVIIFSDSERDISAFKEYEDNGFLSVYSNPCNIEAVIIDGKGIDRYIESLKKLEEADQRFNLSQYLIEHQPAGKNMIIEAGAGTGKTHVMINRIMYLMHTEDSFDFSKVAMITFTNKATDNMRARLYKTLDIKYKLTRKDFYLDKIEELARLNICTIHSFFKQILQEAGAILGYGTNVQLKSFVLEKREILRDILNKHYSGDKRVEDTIGLPIHKIEKLALDYWEKLDDNGFTDSDLRVLDWGQAEGEKAQNIQGSLKSIFAKVDEKYNEIKYINNSISMKDIIHELSRVIDDPALSDYLKTYYDHIFCDEFQDSDNVQIQTIAMLNKIYDGKLFVVGDIKQSIYRFRGATDSAFVRLRENLTEEQKVALFTEPLQKNYRTSEDILDKLDPIFTLWGERGFGLLNYGRQDSLKPQVKHEDAPGIYRQIKINAKDREKTVIELIKEIHSDYEHKQTVCLTRKNAQLQQIKKWCEKEKIVCLIKERGSFYTSPAVLDFCNMAEAYAYKTEPMYLLNYAMSSYCDKSIDVNDLSGLEGDRTRLLNYMYKNILPDDWGKNNDELMNKPVLSVLRKIVGKSEPAIIYGKKRKSALIKADYPENVAAEQAIVDMYQYQANLNKLLQILSDNFSGEFTSLLDICEFLRIQILTDKNEEQEEMEYKGNINYVEGLTVHGAKGLEFDNVIMPFMNDPFNQNFRSEILVSKEKRLIGWVYRENGNEEKNANYNILLDEEKREVKKDETRLLYVAMTRAKYGLFCFPARENRSSDINCWADLLPEE